jgi:hypothetical protein
MNYRVTVERGLVAHFKQPSGPSRPGVDWIVRVEGQKKGVIVRTYLTSAGATEEEKVRLSQRALELVQKKIESGWDPATPAGMLEVSDA